MVDPNEYGKMRVNAIQLQKMSLLLHELIWFPLNGRGKMRQIARLHQMEGEKRLSAENYEQSGQILHSFISFIIYNQYHLASSHKII
jgi:hypothetical protein